MDDEAAGAASQGDERPDADEGHGPGDEIIDLPWDEDLPVALGEESDAGRGPDDLAGGEEATAGGRGAGDEWEHDYDFEDEVGARSEQYFARKRAERRVDTWRSRTATGAIATAIAMGLQQVFEPERRRPAAVAEAPSDPYDEDDPITVEYVPDDAEATTVHVKPWLLQKGDPT